MNLEQKIYNIITPLLSQLEYELVSVKIHTHGKVKVEIVIENIDGSPITIRDCSKASREMSTVLDIEDAIDNQYVLEVSSPGVFRELINTKDFIKFVGKRIQVKVKSDFENNKILIGELLRANEKEISLQIEQDKNLQKNKNCSTNNTVTLSYENIIKASLNPHLKI